MATSAAAPGVRWESSGQDEPAARIASVREELPEEDPPPALGWCALCGHPVFERTELIAGTPTHGCAAGCELERRIRADAAACGTAAPPPRPSLRPSPCARRRAPLAKS